VTSVDRCSSSDGDAAEAIDEGMLLGGALDRAGEGRTGGVTGSGRFGK